jgi:hypothetical protein
MAAQIKRSNKVELTKISSLIELLTLLRNKKADIAFLRKQLGHSFWSNIEPETSHPTRRITLTASRAYADLSTDLARHCNGLVLEYPSWKVLSVPAGMFDSSCRLNNVVKNISKYDVYEIVDGTIVTLYWYNERWNIASTNSWDVGHYQWMGTKTYQEVFDEACAQYPDFSLDKLDRTKSYTVGFRHSDFHPLLADPQKMWFVQSCDLTQLNEATKISCSTTENIGLPLQPRAVVPTTDVKTWITEKTTKALANYTCAVHKGEQPEIYYGLLFRSKVGGQDFMIESELFKTVRGLVYYLPKRNHPSAATINAGNRLDYAVLRAYLSNSGKYVFLQLFPQFTAQYAKYDEMFAGLTKSVVNMLRARRPDRRRSDDKLEMLAITLSEYIRQNSQVNVMDAQGPSIVSDFLLNPRHLDLYYTTLFA